MHHWKPIEIFYVLAILASIMGVLVATLMAFLLPRLQKLGMVNFRWLAAASSKGTRQQGFLSTMQGGLCMLSTAVVSCIGYGYFVEPYNLVIQKLEIQTPKLRDSRFRIVQISDLHCDDKIRLEERIAAVVPLLHPDVIIFCGDACNMPSGLGSFKSLLKSFARLAPTYVAKGDWDFFFEPPLDYFGGTGAHELYNRPVSITKGGESIWLGGTATGSVGLVKEVLSSIPANAFTVFAYHEPRPDMFPASAAVDLFLVGHTHGGQVVLPGFGALVTRSQYGRRYVSGLYQIGKVKMYVNRGIGMEGHFPPVRFLCPPEIAVFDVLPSDRSPKP